MYKFEGNTGEHDISFISDVTFEFKKKKKVTDDLNVTM